MTLANWVTVSRVLLSPAVAALYGLGHFLSAGILFILVAMTDWLDGKLALARNELSRLGSILDPIADRMLFMTALLVLAGDDRLPAWYALAAFVRSTLLVVGLPLLAWGFRLPVRYRASWISQTAGVLNFVTVCLAFFQSWAMTQAGLGGFWVVLEFGLEFLIRAALVPVGTFFEGLLIVTLVVQAFRIRGGHARDLG